MRPREAEEKKIAEYLTEHFKNRKPPEDLIEDCAKISAFLKDKNVCLKHLYRLNQLLEEKVANSNQPLTVNLLRSTLEDELSKFEFKPLFAKAIGVLSPAEFREVLRDKLIIKDITLDSGRLTHGEFTHAIQWLLIVWEQQKDPTFLSKEVSEIYKDLGDERSVYLTDPEEEGNLWDLVVDPRWPKDFRSPEYLSDYLKSSKEPKLETLKNILAIRTNKRKEPSLNWLREHQDSEQGKHTLFKKDEKINYLLRPVSRKKTSTEDIENKEERNTSTTSTKIKK